MSLGIDVIIGNHPHGIQPMYIYSKMEEDQCVDFRFLIFIRLLNEVKEKLCIEKGDYDFNEYSY